MLDSVVHKRRAVWNHPRKPFSAFAFVKQEGCGQWHYMLWKPRLRQVSNGGISEVHFKHVDEWEAHVAPYVLCMVACVEIGGVAGMAPAAVTGQAYRR